MTKNLTKIVKPHIFCNIRFASPLSIRKQNSKLLNLKRLVITIGEIYGADGKKLQRLYKKSVGNYTDWEQKSHAEDDMLFPENLSTELYSTEALQEIRIGHRWVAMVKENDWIIENKAKDKPLPIEVFENGDPRKQLLARNSYLLYKSQ